MAETQAVRQPAFQIGERVTLRQRGGGAVRNAYEITDVERTRSGWLYTIVGPHRTRTAFEQDLRRV